MQVKKFEAKNMKEALQMVKSELGPDAIILQAKDSKKGRGIAGGASVELTAAISEQKYKERQYTLARLKEEQRQKFLQAQAKTQKKYITKAVNSYYEDERIKKKRILPIRRQYIDIDDDEQQQTQQASVPAPITSNVNQQNTNVLRVKGAAKQAFESLNDDFIEKNYKPSLATKGKAHSEVDILKQEVVRLQSVIAKFKDVPQTFVPSHAGSEMGVPDYLAFVYDKLLSAGIAKEILVEIMDKAKEELQHAKGLKPAVVEGWVAKYILDTITVTGDNAGKKIEVFLGASGAGKTASLIKYASHQIIMHRKSVAIITTDTAKVGAVEQLKIYAKILNVPFAIINKQEDWSSILSQLNHVDHILVDTPGYTLKDLSEVNALKDKVGHLLDRARCHFVCPVNLHEKQSLELAKRYQMFHYDDIICTKLDENTNHGSLYTINKKLNVPLHSFGIGPNIPEDFEFATRERVLDLIFKITKKE